MNELQSINLDQNENWIYLELYRLIDGKLVTNPIVISNQTEIMGYNFDDLLLIRSPDLDTSRDHWKILYRSFRSLFNLVT